MLSEHQIIGIHSDSQPFTAQYRHTATASSFRFHHHDMYEFFILVSGEIHLWMGNTLYNIRPGYMFIYPPETLHGLLSTRDNLPYERMYFHISPSLLERFSTDEYSILDVLRIQENSQRLVYRLDENVLHELFDLICEIDALSAVPGSFSTYKRYTLLGNAVMLMMDAVESQKHSDLVVNYQQHTFLPQAIQYINQHYQEPITLEMISKSVNVSRYHLSHEFTRLTNQSVSRYILTRRLHHALRLLQSGASPTEACFQSGFSGYSNFQKAFHAYFGVSPRNYAQLGEHWQTN